MAMALRMASNRPAAPLRAPALPAPRLAIAPPEGPPDPAASANGFDSLFRTYAGNVASVALKVLGRREEAEDIVQETFVAALRHPDRLVDVRNLEAWLVTIAVRLCRKRLRRRRLVRALGFDSNEDYLDVADASAPADVKVTLSRIYTALDTLSPPLRLAWTLRHIAQEPLPEVAQLCGCSLATVKRRIGAAAEALQEIIDA